MNDGTVTAGLDIGSNLESEISPYVRLKTHPSQPLHRAVPYLGATELKRLMLLDAHKVRKGESGMCPELWQRFVNRAHDITSQSFSPKVLEKHPGKQACHVRSVLRFL